MKYELFGWLTLGASLITSTVWAEDVILPKASLADVQKVVDSINADSARHDLFCLIVSSQFEYMVAKDDDERKVIGARVDDTVKKLGDDFARVSRSDLDDDAITVLKGLTASCK